MAASRILLELPVTDAGCGHLRVISHGLDLDAEYDHFSEDLGRDVTDVVRFSGVLAYRFRDEMHSLGRADGSYDALVEITASAWLPELQSIEPEGVLGSVETKTHFAVYFSSNGYLEVIADRFEELPTREGLLGS